MKLKSLLSIVMVALCFMACDDETSTLGYTITTDMDNLEISTDTFKLSTRSIAAGDVLARSTASYLGTIRDPETGNYISANYMTQFHTLENYGFPGLDSIMSRNELGEVIADSCELRLFFSQFYGDSLTSMKCTVHEMARPMVETENYYTNFNPLTEGLIREDGLKVNKTYSLTDMNVERNLRDDTDYTKNIRINLNMPYTDKNGVTYNNYGTYIMRKYYEDPSLFKNSIRMTNNVVPGFYFESTAGLGCLANIDITQLNLYFRYTGPSADSAYVGTTSFAGTQEVMQRTTIINEDDKTSDLINDGTCTYLKTPAGIFTEVTIPVDEICYGHDNDTINTAKFTLQRINNEVHSKYTLSVPTTLLILPKDSLESFFANKDLPNYKTSYLSTYDSSTNTYVFNNIGSLIKTMQLAKRNGETSENWNKAVIVPVTTKTTTINSQEVITSVSHSMALTSTRLVGGPDNPNGDIKISVIYTKYVDKK